MSQQPQQRYTLHLGAGQTMPVTLPTDEPIYRLIERLVYEHGLPTVDQHNQPVRYALYAGHTRRLSSEMSLSQAGYAQGGELYLANVNAPWWEQTTAATRRLQDHHSTSAPNDRRRLYALLGVGAAVVLTMGIVVAALILINSPNPPPVAQLPAATPVAARMAGSAPTSTLAPLPTSPADSPVDTATLTSPPALSTPEPLPAGAAQAPLLSPFAASPSPVATVTLAPLPESFTPVPSPAGAALTPTRIGLIPPFVASPTSTLANPYADAVTVAGVKREYLNRGARLFFQGRTSFGAYVWSEPELRTRLPASQGNVVISNGDRVVILSQEGGVAQVRIVTNALDPADPKVIGATGYLPLWLITDEGVPPPPPTATPNPGKLFVYKLNEDDQPGCISMRIVRTNVSGWSFVVDGTNLRGRFDNAGNARLCGLGPDQQVTISVLDRNGRVVPGGRGVPSKGRAIMIGEWRQ